MTTAELAGLYSHYIACLNNRDLAALSQFVAEDVEHNGRALGLRGYRSMLERDFAEIPDLRFNVELLLVDPPHVASRLRFDCTPVAEFLGLAVNGRTVSFTENVFYEYDPGEARILRVWSIIDKAAIEDQLERRGSPEPRPGESSRRPR